MRILMVTQMWPGPDDPDLGSFLVPIRRELERRGHQVELTAIDHRRRSRTKYAKLTRESIATARRMRPDVIFAHMLFPAGASAALASIASGVPMVVMAHGQDVANIGEISGIRPATRFVVSRAAGVIANSRWLADQLAASIPSARAKTSVADCGIDLSQFTPAAAGPAREALGWDGPGPSFVCVGSLIERKNVIRLADAFARFGEGRLAFVGDGPLRHRLEGRQGVRIVGRIPQAEVPRWIAAADVLCQPSIREPFGQATLEGLAMERSVVSTRVGGPPEFVTPEAGVLVDPFDAAELAEALRLAAAMPTPNAAARAAAAAHDVEIQTGRMLEVLERAARAAG
jgi:glycosyltransferase involved in cell wall biosynthesis